MREPLYDILGMGSRAASIGRNLGATIRGPVLWLTLCGSLLVAAIFAGTIVMVGQFRERALANSERELENTVVLLTRHFDQQFEDSKTIAADLIAQLQVSGLASPEAFKERMAGGRDPRDPEIQGPDLSRRRLPVRFRRRDRQLVAAAPDARAQHRRARLFQGVQVRPAIEAGTG